ncbi:MAG TPA: DUF805 domain-containing protein [Balneolaceae bacterium]|nr:DUF805 domain-containing protein [Balneolaceae bacterium]
MDFNEVKEWYVIPFQKFIEFEGRARRKEFWIFAGVNFLISILLGILGLDLISSLFSLAIIIPSIAVGVRRMHDIGKSGWFLLLGLIPLIGWIILIYFYAKEGDAGPNQYGPNPKSFASV